MRDPAQDNALATQGHAAAHHAPVRAAPMAHAESTEGHVSLAHAAHRACDESVSRSPRQSVQRRRLRSIFGLAAQRAPSEAGLGIVQLFDPAKYKIKVGASNRDMLLRALDTVMESPVYVQIAEIIRDGGGANVVYDDSIGASAHWNSATRTIALNPARIQQARMVVAATLSFELGNAGHDAMFQKLLADVESGAVNTAAEYGRRAEEIEWESAKLRAKASAEMIARGNWNVHNDPTLKHFLKEGESIPIGHGRSIEGDGKWLTFEGFFQTQIVVGHTEGHHERFHELPGRKIALARERFLERKRAREQGTTGGATAEKPADTPKKEEFGARTDTTDPASFIVAEQLGDFWSVQGHGRDWLGRDGNTWRLITALEGHFYFKQVL